MKQDYFRSILDSLEGYKRITPIPEVQRGGVPVDISFTFQDGATLAPRNHGAFSLNNGAECKMDFYSDGSYKPDETIVRINFSYDLYERMIENRALATYFLQRAIDHAKLETDKLLKIDSSKTLYGTSYLDYNIGGRQEVLLQLANSPGYELRFYSKCRN